MLQAILFIMRRPIICPPGPKPVIPVSLGCSLTAAAAGVLILCAVFLVLLIIMVAMGRTAL
jgi:hypothetical protein